MTGDALDARDALDALHRRVHPPALVDPAVLDAAVDRALAERERRLAAAAARAECERAEALATGGPCRYCGITRSWEHDREADKMVGRWYVNVCVWCDSDGQGGSAAIGRTDAERRDMVLRQLLPPEVTKWHGREYLAKTSGFRWWSETPGAVTSETERFAYVDRQALVERLQPRGPEYATREPCERCGCPSMWLFVPAVDWTPAIWRCKGCENVTRIGQLAAAVTGLKLSSVADLGAAMERVLGVAWWKDHPAGGAAKPPRPCTIPFAYIDRRAARARAYELFAGQDWAEHRFGGPPAYEAARQAAQEVSTT